MAALCTLSGMLSTIDHTSNLGERGNEGIWHVVAGPQTCKACEARLQRLCMLTAYGFSQGDASIG